MILLKSFFRKKSTKIYIILFSLLLIGIIFLKAVNNEYLSVIKENQKNNYLSIVTNEDVYYDLLKIRNVDRIVKGVPLDISFDYIDYIIIRENIN